MFTSLHSRAQAAFHPAPSIEGPAATKLGASSSVPESADILGVLVGSEGALKEHGLDRAVVEAMVVSWRRAELTPRQRALAEFASKLTLHPADADESYIGGLRDAGLGEEEIFEAAQIVAIYNSNNRLNNVIGLRPDEGARAAFRAG